MPDDLDFKTFFNEKVKEKGASLQKLSEATNIAITHLENLTNGKYADLPPAPYLHGYIDKLGYVLGFDPEEWWEKLKRERAVKVSGAQDSLPKNRFAKEFSVKLAAGVGGGLLVILVLAWRLPQILGVPQITLIDPAAAVQTATVSEFTFEGKLASGDSLAINGENVQLGPDGAWSKIVSLQPGANNFEITAQKMLGRSVTLVREIIYQPPLAVAPTSTPTSTPQSPSATSTPF